MNDPYKGMSDDDRDISPIADEHEEERGEPETSSPRRKSRQGRLALVIVGMVLVGVLAVGGILAFMISSTSHDPQEDIPDETLSRPDRADNTLSDMKSRLREAEERRAAQEAAAERERREKEEMARRARENADQVLSSNAPPTGPYAGGQRGAPAQSRDDVTTPGQRKLQGDILMTSGSGSSAADALAQAQQGGGSMTERSTKIGDALRGETYEPGSAQVMQNMDMLLRRGTVIPCVIQNRVVSTYPGLSSCQITQDVYSADGRTLLVERGSVAYGEQKVSLQQGQARLFMTWNEIDTAGGVRIRIDSLGVDSLGASGVDAYVDKHFWDRFGGAIMLSFIDDGLEALASRLEKNRQEDGVSFENSTDNAENMAEIALRDSIDIPPTGYVNQGTLMNIRVARDVDFSSVYHVRGRR